MTTRGWLAAAAGALAGLLIAAPVSAATTINLNPAHRNSTAAGFGTQDCTGPLAGHPNEDGWHFVLPAGAGDDFVSITLTYSTPGGNVTVGPITSQDASMPTMGPGWSGFLDSAGMSGEVKHAYVLTTPGWILLNGTAQVEPDTAMGTFNLSHTCPGAGGNGPTAGPTPSGGARTGGGGGQPMSWFGTTAAFFVSLGLIGYLVQRRRRA